MPNQGQSIRFEERIFPEQNPLSEKLHMIFCNQNRHLELQWIYLMNQKDLIINLIKKQNGHYDHYYMIYYLNYCFIF